METELSKDTFEKSMETDLDSVSKLNNGDPKALKLFFDGFYPSVCVYAIKFIKQSDAAEDIALDAFVQFWKIRDHFTSILKIRAFIYTTVRNACINYLKQKMTRENILAHSPLIEETSYELLIEEETYRLLDVAINQLSARTREIMLLAVEGHNNSEIAAILGISVNTIKTLKKNAYSALRHMLSNQAYLFLLLNHVLR